MHLPTPLTSQHPSTTSPPPSPSPFHLASIFRDGAVCHLMITHSSPNHPFRITHSLSVHHQLSIYAPTAHKPLSADLATIHLPFVPPLMPHSAPAFTIHPSVTPPLPFICHLPIILYEKIHHNHPLTIYPPPTHAPWFIHPPSIHYPPPITCNSSSICRFCPVRSSVN